MYYVITDSKVYSSKSLNGLNKKMNSLFEEDEFKTVGSDKVLYMTTKDITFVQDKKKLSQIPMRNLYKKDSNIIIYVILILNIILLFR